MKVVGGRWLLWLGPQPLLRVGVRVEVRAIAAAAAWEQCLVAKSREERLGDSGKQRLGGSRYQRLEESGEQRLQRGR